MKIAIDISQTVFGTGVSVYTKNLVKALLTVDTQNEYVLFGGSLRRFSELKELAESFKGNFTSKIFPYPPAFADFVWNRLHTFPIEKLIGKVDIIHTSDWTEPPSSAVKITTVHDLYPFKFPKLVHPKILDVHKRKMSWVIKESKKIIVPSESTKKDVVDLGAKEEIIQVISEAPELSKASETEIFNVKKKFQIQGDYLISVGVTPLKNTQKIIEAFHLSRAGRDLKLIIVGNPSNIKINQERNVRILGHVTSRDLAALLTGARALVFASLYEGYGIPILNAFACGVPVVTSNISSMPEVAGDAAILVDPYDVNSIVEGIEKALKAPKGLIEKGIARVKDFSWEKTAKETLAVYTMR